MRDILFNMASVRLKTLREAVGSTLWFVPAIMTAAAVAMAAATVRLDRTTRIGGETFFFYSGGPEGARAVLSTIAGSMITVAGVVFSVTMVALSFASSQLGPRLLRSFMRDRGNQVVLGTCIATFVYSLLVLRTVREQPPEFVPHLGVTAGLLTALCSLAALIYFIHHTATSLQADYVIGAVAEELDRSIENLYPGAMGDDSPRALLPGMNSAECLLKETESAGIVLAKPGYVNALDLDAVMKVAEERDLVLHVISRPGKYVHDGVPVAEGWPISAVDDDVRRRVADAFILGRTRTSQQDVEFAVNQLVEVAVRALSPGVNDPFTAITCIDRLTTALLHLTRKEFPSRFRIGPSGKLRVIADRPDFLGITDSAFHQIRQAGAAMPAVTIRLLESLTLLLAYARSDEQRRAFERHVELVARAGRRETPEQLDRQAIASREEEAEARSDRTED